MNRLDRLADLKEKLDVAVERLDTLVAYTGEILDACGVNGRVDGLCYNGLTMNLVCGRFREPGKVTRFRSQWFVEEYSRKGIVKPANQKFRLVAWKDLDNGVKVFLIHYLIQEYKRLITGFHDVIDSIDDTNNTISMIEDAIEEDNR